MRFTLAPYQPRISKDVEGLELYSDVQRFSASVDPKYTGDGNFPGTMACDASAGPAAMETVQNDPMTSKTASCITLVFIRYLLPMFASACPRLAVPVRFRICFS
jgi:hypothetical protein